ncbi:SpaA isopeptide-forming pilin-related protein, partial [Enterococcus faecalis]
ELYEVKDGQVVGAVKATKTAEYTVDRMGEGDWSLDFGKVTGLEAGKTYVVYETATSKDNLVDKNKDNTPEEKHVVEHKDPNDKAQTVVVTPEVPKEKEVQVSKVNLGGEEIAGANIEIKQGTQVVANWVSEVGKTHELRLLPGDYVFHEVAAPKGYVAVTDITFTVNTDGTVTVKEAQGNTVTGVDNKLTVTDQAEYVSPTGTLRTTVKANNVVGKTTEAAKVTADQVKNGVNVVDTITYSGLVPGKVYDVTG